MRRRVGTEMRKLILAITVMVLVLVFAIIAYFLIDVILTTNNNIEHNKRKLAEESALSVEDLSENVADMSGSTEILKLFNQDIIQAALEGDIDTIYEFILDLSIYMHPVEYVAVIVDGRLIDYRSRLGGEIIPGEMPVEPPQAVYDVLEKIGQREGYFVSVFYPVDLGILGVEQEIYVNSIDDITADVQEIESYFENQRNDMIIRLGAAAIIALLLTLLITTTGLRYFTGKYVARPLDELNRMAEGIADGTFEGDVEVDEKSAYAALQGLLRSGQLIIRKMSKDLEEE